MASMKDQLAQALAAIHAMQLQQGATTATAPNAAPAATAAPSWVTEAKAAAKAKPAKAASGPPPTFVVRPATFHDVPGYSIVKMFGTEPDRRRPDGKFVTAKEAAALLAFVQAGGR